MSISEEAARKRLDVPEQFRAGDASLPLSGRFAPDAETDISGLRSAIVGTGKTMDDEIAFIEADSMEAGSRKIETLQDMRDWSTTLAGMDTDEERRDALAGVLSGRMITNYFAFLDKRRSEAQAENRKANREAHYMALLYAQIAELDIQIGQLEDAQDYLKRTGDVEGTMDKPGVQAAIKAWEKRNNRKFDPDDPKAAAILDDIIEDDIKAKKQQKAEAEREAGIVNAGIDQERERDEVLDPELADTNRTYEGRSETIDQAVREERKETTKEVMQVTSDVEDLETLKLEDLAQYDGGPEYTVKIDEFIENAAPHTLAKHVGKDPDSDLAIRVGMKDLREKISELDEFKGTPDYQMYVQMAVDEAPEAVRKALRNEPNLSDELATALYEPYSDELDAENEIALANADAKATEPLDVDAPQPNDSAVKPLGLG